LSYSDINLKNAIKTISEKVDKETSLFLMPMDYYQEHTIIYLSYALKRNIEYVESIKDAENKILIRHLHKGVCIKLNRDSLEIIKI
jgi:hypothetical protein